MARWRTASAQTRGGEPPALDAIVLDGRQRPALVAVRELGRAGIAVGSVESDPRASAFASRWCRVGAVVPDLAVDPDAYVDTVLQLTRRHRPRVLIPVHDGSIEALRRRRAEIEREVAVALAPEPALGDAISKTRSFEAATAVGLRLPRGAVVGNSSDAAAALDSVGLPAVVKPVQSWVQESAEGTRLIPAVATTRERAIAAITEIVQAGVEAIVQEWLPGAREAISFIYGRGRVWARFAQRADRTMPPLGGNSVFRVSIPLPPDITHAAERFVREVGLEGYTEVEFRRDAVGRPAFMEVNPRLSASVEVAVRAGVPFPELIYRLAVGEPLVEVDGYRAGVRMRWLGGDLSWLRAVASDRSDPDVPSPVAALGRLVGDFARPSGYDYLDPRDLRPALVASTGAVRRAGRLARPLRSRGPASPSDSADVDVTVIGAGPYGLSLAAHLAAAQIDHRIFGEPMDTWSNHMPAGMYLKSEGYASSLSDPAGEHTLKRFCAESGREYGDVAVPVSLEAFTSYGHWFQERLVPQLDRRLVQAVRSTGSGFDVRLADGEAFRSRSVVVATGMQGHAYVPPVLRDLPPSRLVHAFDYADPSNVPDGGVLVIGAGQSALEGAALIQEQGGDTRVLVRQSHLDWGSKPGPSDRALMEKLRYPESGLGQGRGQWFYSNFPLIFKNGPSDWRHHKAFSVLGPSGSWWLRPRFEGQVETLVNREPVEASATNGAVQVRVRGTAGMEELTAGLILAGTGYRLSVDGFGFLDPELRTAIRTDRGTPLLNRSFESSVPWLFFVGYPAAVEFGPLMRFVYGADFAVRRVARQLSRA